MIELQYAVKVLVAFNISLCNTTHVYIFQVVVNDKRSYVDVFMGLFVESTSLGKQT